MTTTTDDELLVLSRTVEQSLTALGDKAVDARESWRVLAELGMTYVGLAEASGGSGGTLQQAAAVLHASAALNAGAPLVEASWLAGWIAEHAGWSVPDAPIGLLCAQDLRAESDGDVISVSGTIDDVPAARHADEFAVLLPSARAGWASVGRVRADAVRVEPADNIAGEPRDTVVLDRVRIAKDSLASVQVSLRDVELRNAVARLVQGSGAAARIERLTIEHVTTRLQFGRPLSRFQVVQHRVASLAASRQLLSAAADLAVDALARTAPGRPAPVPVLAALAAAFDASGDVAAQAHQLLGAMGFTTEHPLHLSTTRLWAWRQELGGPRPWLTELADVLLDPAGNGAWALITADTRDTEEANDGS